MPEAPPLPAPAADPERVRAELKKLGHKPKAERMYPRVAAAAGFAWNSSSAILRPAKPYVDRAVGDRVEELFANGDGGNTELVKREMIDTKNRTLKHLFGAIGALKR